MAHRETVIDGKAFPSVTEISKLADDASGLVEWAKSHTRYECNRILYESQSQGIQFHDEVAAYLQHGVFDETSRVYPYVLAISKWRDLVGYEPLWIEQYVESRKYLYGGTLDTGGTVCDSGHTRTEIIDFKLTGAVRKSAVIQPVGYIQALKETFGVEVDNWRIVRPYDLKFPAKATEIVKQKYGYKYCFKGSTVFIEERRYSGFDRYWPIFEGLRKLWDFTFGKGEWEELGK